jgi:hypothetical protein
MKQSSRQRSAERLRKQLGKFKKHPRRPLEVEKIVKESEDLYKVQRRRDIITIKKEPKQPLVLQKRQELQSHIININHQTGKLDMSTYQVMRRQYTMFLKKYKILPVEMDELIQLRINTPADKETSTAKRFLKKYFNIIESEK